ncbi:hypothetical protein JM93_00867 [Roseibium hamelinense]|uniref:Uncharacterized protein n=2 Tax=Roseibium hamelinense TaxID=150831 RepID=A0A562TI26_9HYPH|nr:hypothetical protein JM93_00867 [Roseibium hamelinense]
MQFSASLAPQHSKAYYVDQAHKYFDTLDSFAPRSSQPAYASHVLRWEWPPWLYLTGHKDHFMVMDKLVVLFPARVTDRTCRAFEVQPFARCRVTFEFDWTGARTPIYEEFTFNSAGEITFVEVWSDAPGLRPMAVLSDPWAEDPAVDRLSTRVPGLGRADGRYQLDQLKMLATGDTGLASLNLRLEAPMIAWAYECGRFFFADFLPATLARLINRAGVSDT